MHIQKHHQGNSCLRGLFSRRLGIRCVWVCAEAQPGNHGYGEHPTADTALHRAAQRATKQSLNSCVFATKGNFYFVFQFSMSWDSILDDFGGHEASFWELAG